MLKNKTDDVIQTIFVYSSEYGYDLNNNVSKFTSSAGGVSTTERYEYGADNLATKEYLRREIEANEKVLKYAKAYGLTDKDVESTSRNLKKYYSQWNEVNGDV